MIIDDPIYGWWRVEEVLSDLIRSRPVQRLKKSIRAGRPIWSIPPGTSPGLSIRWE